jgi:hypothetical protein
MPREVDRGQHPVSAEEFALLALAEREDAVWEVDPTAYTVRRLVPFSMPPEVDAGEVLACSLADCEEYWNAQGTLTAAQKRRREFERELRTNCAAQGCGVPAANDPIIAQIRSGEWERRQKRIGRQMRRDQAKLAQWKREGYSFDAEHRLVAPPRTELPEGREPIASPGEQGRRARRAPRWSRGSSDDPDLPPPPVKTWRGVEAASVRMVQHCERRRAKAAAA